MNVSYYWLKDLVDFDLKPDAVAERLTMVGLEAEGIDYQKNTYDGIVVGRVLSVKTHPKADNLFILAVDIGKERLNVVCGAKNLSVGDKVPVAKVHTRLPTGKKIEKVEIKGILSWGMICSEMELGLEESSEGIMILPKDAKPGESIAAVLGLDDIIIDINVTPNRPDCLSMTGVAREIASIVNKKVKVPKYSIVEEEENIKKFTSVTIEDPDLCPRYTARVIRDVKIAPSPSWMQKRLRAVGLRPINNIVDITNYVLLELGHPLHAFDYDLLRENRIVVRRARNNEEIITLDNIQRKLDNETLIIADSKSPVAIAGIMGGVETSVNDKTQNILLESAYFDPVSIRRASKRLKLHTESSHRFERGADPEEVVQASARAAYLIREISKGKIAKGQIDNYPKPIKGFEVTLRTNRVNWVLGTDLKEKTIGDYLKKLGLKTKKTKGDELKVEIPSFRRDLTREIDLIEEVVRLHGYDNIPTTLPPARLSFKEKDRYLTAEKGVRDILVGCGFFEVINYSFISEADIDRLKIKEKDKARRFVTLRNPISKEAGIMRTTLIPGLLHNIALNHHHSIYDVMIFEVGKVFIAKTEDELPDERRHLCAAISGSKEEVSWYSKKDKSDFFDMKGVVEVLLEKLNIPKADISPLDVEYLYPSSSMRLNIRGKNIGIFGQISPDVLESFDIHQDTYVLEIELENQLLSSRKEREFKPLPKYPALLRDIAIVVDERVSSEEVRDIIIGTDSHILKEARLFDVYRGKPIPTGEKSLAYSLTYRADDRTLTDKEIDQVHSDIIERLRKKIGARLR